MRPINAIPVGTDRPEALASLGRAREELRHGHVVSIFAEGAISRTGNLLPFTRGFEHIAKGLDVPVIPVYLDQVWGSIFSPARRWPCGRTRRNRWRRGMP
jgi:acyl-[acyl-carrier-protein]-phospholipid O-acyltransferase/long-chain-fatty-acid--[acyl-carrier-protein] ligase